MGTLKDAWEILRSRTSIRPFIATALVFGLVIFSPRWILESMHLYPAIEKFWPWLVLIFSFSIAMLLIYSVEAMAAPIIHLRKMKARFHVCAKDEKQILRQRFLEPNNSTAMLWPHEPGVGTLLADGVLFKASESIDNPNGMTSFGLSPTARKVILKHRAKVLSLLS